MAAKQGSFRQSFLEKKQRLLSQKGSYVDFGYSSLENLEGETKRRCCHSFGDSIINSWKGLKEFFVKGWEFGRADPRKFIFSAKVGLALVIITVLLYLHIPSNSLDQYAVWAILTVVLVFEFTIGATLSKGFNRGLGTLSAGGIALAVAELSILSGRWEEAIILISIFLAGSCSTFIKQYPTMKEYEYGFRVFLLTFCIILSYGKDFMDFYKKAVSRFVLILLGAVVSLVINICIYPIWAGEDLHDLVVKNFSSVATSLEGCVNGYLHCVNYERIPSKVLSYQAADGPLYKAYMSAVESKSREDTLFGFAVWEPPHGRYKMFNYPWKNYVQVSTALRHCAFSVMALHGCLLSEIQAPPERRQAFSHELLRVGNEGARVLRELGEKVKKMEKLKQRDDILLQVHEAAEELQLKIDQKSYLLVNSESWVIGRRTKDTDILEDSKDNENNLLVFKSQSEAVLNFGSDGFSKNSYNYNPERKDEFLARSVPSESMFKKQQLWPEDPLPGPDVSLNLPGALPGEESKAYESASALSLATFASLLIEFVARLQNLVEIFEELSEVAKFEEPSVDTVQKQEIFVSIDA